MLINATVSSTAGGTIATSDVSSFAYNGITYTLDGTYPVGTFYDGSPFIVSSSAGKITATSEPSATLNGGVAYGMMKNPFIEGFGGTADDQGLDEFLDLTSSFSSLYSVNYLAAANIDPAASDGCTWTLGEKASFVKAIRHPSKTSSSAQFQTLSRYDTITILDAAPPLRTVRPGRAGTTKRLRQVPSSFTPRGLSLPAGFDTVANIIAAANDDLAPFTEDLVIQRFWRLINDRDASVSDAYSAKFVDNDAKMIVALNSSSATANQRDEIMIKIMVNGCDVDAALEDISPNFTNIASGTVTGQGAGQGGSTYMWAMAMGILAGDAAVITRAGNKTQVDASCFWVTSADVGQPPGQPAFGGDQSPSAVPLQAYFTEQVGEPWCQPEFITGSYGRYTDIGLFITGWEVAAVCCFDIGPTGYANGSECVLQGGASNNISNRYGASLAMTTKGVEWNPWPLNSSYSFGTAFDDLWATVTAFGDFTDWAGSPDQPPARPNSSTSTEYFTVGASAGEIDLDKFAVDYSVGAVTQRDVRYSLDGYQFVELSNVTFTGDNYTITGLLQGAAHWCSWRIRNASGTGIWSRNFPKSGDFATGTDNNNPTTSGTPSALIPDYTGGTAPVILKRAYPDWLYAKYMGEDTSGISAAVEGDELACGAGYPGNAAYPAPTYTYLWKRDGSSLGVTTKGYTVVAGDVGTTLTCEITATNASGSDIVTTAGVTVT